MAFKGIGFDDSNIKNQTMASGDTLEIDGDITVAEGIAVSSGGATIVGNSSITGNLTVTGNLISQDELQVLVKDNFLDLNVGYVGTAYEQTGLTFNYQAISGKTFTVDSATNNLTFTAGSTTLRARLTLGGTSVISGGTFAVGDILQISGTIDGENDGIYVVHDQATADTIDIKSSTLTVPDTVNSAFALLNFTAQSQSAGTVTIAIVNLMALRASSAGELQSATGDSDTDFSSYSSVGADTPLQDAYVAGNTITTTGNNILFTLSSGDFSVQGTGSVLIGNSTAVSAFGVTSSGTSTIISAGINTLRSSGANVVIQSDSNTVDVNGAALDVDTTGNITLNTSGGAGNFIVVDELDLQSTNGNVDIDAGGDVQIDASGAVSIQGAETSDFTVTGNSASTTNVAITAGNINGDATIGLTAKTSIINTIGVTNKFTITSTSTTHAQAVVFDSTGGFSVSGESTSIDSIKDEDDLTSDDENALATQQSIKAYVDNRGENANYNSISELTVAPSTTVTARQVITVNAGGSAALARADVEATSRVVGFALNGGSNGQSILVAQNGTLGGFSGLSAGSAYYLDDTTNGSITATAPTGSGDTVFQVGYALTATTLVIQMRHIMVIG